MCECVRWDSVRRPPPPLLSCVLLSQKKFKFSTLTKRTKKSARGAFSGNLSFVPLWPLWHTQNNKRKWKSILFDTICICIYNAENRGVFFCRTNHRFYFVRKKRARFFFFFLNNCIHLNAKLKQNKSWRNKMENTIAFPDNFIYTFDNKMVEKQ